MSPKRISIMIVLSMIMSTIVAVTYSYKQTLVKEKAKLQKNIVEFPYYDEYMQVGREYGLDMSFTKHVWNISDDHSFANPYFKSEKKSFDVILFGDSTMAIGVIPQVLEQMTGLKIGIFASGGMVLTDSVVKVLEKISRFYLKEDGLLILAFSEWSQTYNFSENGSFTFVPEWIREVSPMTDAQFEEYIDRGYTLDLVKDVSPEERQKGSFDYRKTYIDLKGLLKDNYSLTLPESTIYSTFIEPELNAEWFNKKMENQELGDIKYYVRWDNKTILQLIDRTRKRTYYAIRSTIEADPAYENANAKLSAELIRKVKYRMAYAIGLGHEDVHYLVPRSIYEKYYSSFCEKLDLGLLLDVSMKIEMENLQHTTNVGSIYKSILYGQWIRDNFKKE